VAVLGVSPGQPGAEPLHDAGALWGYTGHGVDLGEEPALFGGCVRVQVLHEAKFATRCTERMHVRPGQAVVILSGARSGHSAAMARSLAQHSAHTENQ